MKSGKITNGILLLVFGVFFVGCTKTDPPVEQPQVVFKVDLGDFADIEANKKIIQDIYSHFVERVRGESKVDSIGITLNRFEPSPYDLYLQENYGWYNEVEIIIKIADDDKTIYEGLPMMRNNLFYYFGGGRRPGMSILKEHSAYFYGFKKDMIVPGEETFVDDRFYKIIDDLTL